MTRVARDVVGSMLCVISDYSVRALALARRLRAIVVADRPGPTIEQQLQDARDAGEIESLYIIDITGDSVPIFPGAPDRPRRMTLTNGGHSSREALAFDLHVRGHTFDAIGDAMGVDAETARTFVRRAEAKNRVYPDVSSVLRQVAAANRGA